MRPYATLLVYEALRYLWRPYADCLKNSLYSSTQDVSISQHAPAYVSIRQKFPRIVNTGEYADIWQASSGWHARHVNASAENTQKCFCWADTWMLLLRTHKNASAENTRDCLRWYATDVNASKETWMLGKRRECFAFQDRVNACVDGFADTQHTSILMVSQRRRVCVFVCVNPSSILHVKPDAEAFVDAYQPSYAYLPSYMPTSTYSYIHTHTWIQTH